MLRLLFLTIFVFLAACAPASLASVPMSSQSGNGSVSAPDAVTVPSGEPRVLQAEAHYLGPLQPRDIAFESVTPIAKCDPAGANASLYAPAIAVVGPFLEVYVCYRGNAEDYAAFHIYLETGEKPAFLVGGLQAHYLVENDSLFRYVGAGRDWRWEFVAPVVFDALGGEASWSIPLSLLGTSGRALLEVTDKSWAPFARTAPLAFNAP